MRFPPRREWVVLVSLVAGLLAPAPSATADDTTGPPVAPAGPVIDHYHGAQVSDPYRYFEDFTNPEVQRWVKGQADYAKRTLAAIPGRDALLARIRELDAGAPYRLTVVRRWPHGGLHYLKRLARENLDKFYVRDAKTGEERLKR